MGKKCVIVGAGDFRVDDMPELFDGDLLIAADGGQKNIAECGLVPDVFIGDLDSSRTPPENIKTVILPRIKDDTDTVAAVKYGLERGYAEFVLLGGTGGKRLSHTAANIQTLAYLKSSGANGVIIGGKSAVRYLSAGDKARFTDEKGFFSLFAASDDAVLDISGAKYSGKGIEINRKFPLGVSNEFLPGKTEITVLSGEAILIVELN